MHTTVLGRDRTPHQLLGGLDHTPHQLPACITCREDTPGVMLLDKFEIAAKGGRGPFGPIQRVEAAAKRTVIRMGVAAVFRHLYFSFVLWLHCCNCCPIRAWTDVLHVFFGTFGRT